MSKTNSNCITSILVTALNDKESGFSKSMREIFSRKIQRKVSDEVIFYNCTYTPLLYKEMNGTEIDIIARIPGVHKPIMMIEVKANIDEPLQASQSMSGEYEKTAKTHKIPLVYIIPKNYIHRKKLPKAKIITWEEIKKEINKKIKVSFDSQIEQFVEIISNDNLLSKEEIRLLKNKNLMKVIFKFKKENLGKIKETLERRKRKQSGEQEDQWGVGYYYNYKKNDCFIGFNPHYISDGKEDKFLALCIAETSKNTDLGDNKKIYFEDGYYFVPILNSKCIEGDEVILKELRTIFRGLSIQQEVKTNFSIFFSLKNKIGEEFDKIFVEHADHYEINTEAYDKVLKEYTD